MQQMEIWLVILVLSRKKFHAEQIFVLTGFMKLGPVHFFTEKIHVKIHLSEFISYSLSNMKIKG